MAYYRLFYHFIWSTKERMPLITPLNRQAIYACIADKVVESRGITHAIGGMPDHVHLVATVPPAVSLSSLLACCAQR